MATLQFKAKNFFFDRKKVENILGKESAQAIIKSLAFVRTRARSSLRRRKKIAAPGSPPSVHSNHPVASLKNIWFALDTQSLTGVAGPLVFQSQNIESNSAGTGAALQEFGGRAVIRRRQRRSRQPIRRKSATFAPHPFMLPALKAEAPKFPSLWLTSGGAAA